MTKVTPRYYPTMSSTPKKLKLWASPATCSLLPHILLREINADFELFIVDIMKTNGFPEEYRRVNPKKRLPILEYPDGTVITETVAITTAISQMAPGHHLLGTSNLETVRCYEWFNWLSGTFHERGFGGYFQPGNFADDEGAHDAVRRQALSWIQRCYGDIEEKLTSTYAVGEGFTAVDVFLYVIYRWGHLLKLDMPGRFPKYTALVEVVTKRAAVVEAAMEENIPLIKDNRLEGIELK